MRRILCFQRFGQWQHDVNPCGLFAHFLHYKLLWNYALEINCTEYNLTPLTEKCVPVCISSLFLFISFEMKSKCTSDCYEKPKRYFVMRIFLIAFHTDSCCLLQFTYFFLVCKCCDTPRRQLYSFQLN